jgi:hypothetical protein
MQIRGADFSRLRQKLRELAHSAPAEIGAFLSSEPIVKGSVYTLRRRCSKPSCRCARGEKHETVVMTASVGGKTRLWTLSADQISELKRGTQRYRQFRLARAQLVKRQQETLRLVDAIEKVRTQPA